MQQIQDINVILAQANQLVKNIEALEINQQANIVAKNKIEQNIRELQAKRTDSKEAYEIATHAIEILRSVSDKQVAAAYKFLENSINDTLERMFSETTRKIHLKETSRGQYPQLEIELTVANGKRRSIKSDSGHGLAQIISIISIICLIHITHSRKIVVMDEVASGLSVHNREVLAELLWQFTEVGFQFIVNEHGFVPKGSKVFHMEMVGDVSSVKSSYIEQQGVYLNSDASYSNLTSVRQQAVAKETSSDDELPEENMLMQDRQESVMQALKSHNIQSIIKTQEEAEKISESDNDSSDNSVISI